jgi:hypothetical protein
LIEGQATSAQSPPQTSPVFDSIAKRLTAGTTNTALKILRSALAQLAVTAWWT